MSRGSILHVGCGFDHLPEYLADYVEIRLDINPGVAPDIVASMTDLGNIGPFDALFCNHALEHVNPHEVSIVLSEFRRVLKDGGYAMIYVPDLEGVAPTHEVLMDTPAGDVTGHDLFYGFGPTLKDNPYMAHHCGFVSSTLKNALQDAGFSKVSVARIGNYNMLGVGVR